MTTVIREVLAMSNNNVSGQVLTSSSSVASGDTFVVIQCSDNNTLSAATSSAGTLTQVGTDQADGNGNGILRIWTCDAGSGGAQTVTFPVAGGFDLYGVVLICTGTSTVEGFAKAADGVTLTTHTTPATASLTGAADLLVSAGFYNAGTTGTWDISSSGLTQQAQVTTGFGSLYVGTATLSASGASPTYTVLSSGFTKAAFTTIGLDDGGATPPAAARPRTQIVAPNLAATFRASW